MHRRRDFLKTGFGIAAGGAAFEFSPLKNISYGGNMSPEAATDYFKELQVKPFINAGLPYSTLGGSEMWPEVIEAMNYAAVRRAKMSELHDAVGRRIAGLIGCESAMIPAGASSGITLGTAACITGSDREKINRLPDTAGMKNRVLIQKAHHYVYEQAVRCCGAELIEIETIEDFDKSAGKNIAMALFYYGRESKGLIDARKYVELGKKHRIPVMFDGATTVPPAVNMKKIMAVGCDLACFSGGKGLQGPFSAGLLLGRSDLIQSARLNASPYDGTIGRGMKVSKEELLGMMVAVEVSLRRDYQADINSGKIMMKKIENALSGIKGLKFRIYVPEKADQMPRLSFQWDLKEIQISPEQLVSKLREGEPSIEVVGFGQSGGAFEISSWMLKPKEVPEVIRRIREELKAAI